MLARRPLVAAVSVLAGLVLAAAGAAPAVGARPMVRQAVPVTAEFTARVLDGFDESWRHYQERQPGDPSTRWHRYDSGVFITPVNLLCQQPGGVLSPTARFVWSVRAADGTQVPVTTGPRSCVARFVAAPGSTYAVTLAANVGGETVTATRDVRVRHRELIVSLGDSYSSGEGSPPWQDERCHRSVKSGVAKAARRLEVGNRRAVTFLSFACSGDEIDAGINGPSNGAKPQTDCRPRTGTALVRCIQRLPKLAPQIDAATRLLCGGRSPCPADGPHADSVFLNIGINDIAFSHLLQNCLNPYTYCDTDNDKYSRRRHRGVRAGHAQIVAGLAQLAPRLATGPFAGARVFLVRYPDDPFDTGSRNSVHPCGIFQDLTGNEALYMHTEGLTLNRLLLFAAARHDWIPVTVAGSFAGHGYCAEHPWLRPFGSSEVVQGDKDGTMHPNGPGHEAVADEVLHGYAAPFVPRVQVGNATVTFDAVKLVDRQATQPNGLAPDHTAAAFFFQTSSQQYGVPISAPALMSYPAHTTTRISMVDETPLPPGISQRVAVYNKDPLVIEVHTTSLPLRISSARRLVRRIRHDERTDPRDDPVDPYPPANPAPRALRLTVSHGAGDSYGASSSTGVGAGIHTATRTTAIGTIQVRYHVTFEPLAATAGR